MRIGSAAFEAARQASEPIYVSVSVTTGGELIASTEADNPDERITFVSSSDLSLDSGAAVSSAINSVVLRLPDPLVPLDSFGALSPHRSPEFLFSTGYVVNGKPITEPSALMVLEDIEILGGGRTVTINLLGREKNLERAVFGWPREIAAGSNIPVLINELLREVYPTLSLVSPQIGTGSAPMSIADTDNRLNVIQRLAESIGFTFAFDAVGTPRLYAPPNPDSEPVVNFSSIDNRDGLISVRRKLTREGVYNGVITKATTTRGTDADTGDTQEPLRAEAWSDNTLTPLTYSQADADRRRPGAYPLLRTTQTLTTQSEVDIATREAASIVSLPQESLILETKPIPGLELFDSISVEDPETGTFGKFTVTKISRPTTPAGNLTISANSARSGLGSVLALGLIEQRTKQATPPISTEVGTVSVLDEDGNPPTITLTDGRRLRYRNDGSTYAVGDRVMVILNGDASYVDGHLTNTPEAPVTPTDDWFYTTATTGAGGLDADRPPLGFRFWQGTSDVNGEAEVSTGIGPTDVLIATVTSPEYSSGSRQTQRPVKVKADGVAVITGMHPGRPWKMMIVAKKADADTPGDYDYIASGNNANNDDNAGGKHPRFAIAYKTGTLSATGTRSAGSLPAGVDDQWTAAVHVRVIVNGESVDVSRMAEDNLLDVARPRVAPDGTIDASHSEWEHVRGQTYYMTWIHTPTTALYTATGSDHVPTSGWIGRDAIGTFPQFEMRLLDYGTLAANASPPNWVDGRFTAETGIAGAKDKIVAVYANDKTQGDETFGAEYRSDFEDLYELQLPEDAGRLLGVASSPFGLSVVLRGADTAKPAARAGFTTVTPTGETAASLAASAVDDNETAGTSWSMVMPTHSTGQLLVALVACHGYSENHDVTFPVGWTRHIATNDGSGSPNMFVFSKIAASGSEAPTASITGTNTTYNRSSIVLAFDDAVSMSASAVDNYSSATSIDFDTGPSAHDIYVHISAAGSSQAAAGLPSGDTAVAVTAGAYRKMRVSSNTSSSAITGHSVASGPWASLTIGVK